MTPELRAGLRALAEAGVAVLVPPDVLRDLLDGTAAVPAPSARALPSADYTVRQIGERFGRRPSTVRAWLESGRLRGYRFGNREWRATAEALHEFEEAERQRGNGKAGVEPSRSRTRPVNLSAWRDARSVS
jgi:excisionase family DNA binding protein